MKTFKNRRNLTETVEKKTHTHTLEKTHTLEQEEVESNTSTYTYARNEYDAGEMKEEESEGERERAVDRIGAVGFDTEVFMKEDEEEAEQCNKLQYDWR